MKKAFLLFFAIGFLLCGGCYQNTAKIADDEIMLQIQLNLEEDIGLIVIDYTSGDTVGSGGTSNADKSMLKRDELLPFSWNKQNFETPTEPQELTVRFTIITEYFEPNYDNIYPEECTVPLNEITLSAEYGKAYSVTISGGQENGYKAVLQQ